MRTAILRGREHATLGGVSAVSEGRAAVALSIGGAPKSYPHTDPNEDAAAFAEGEGGILVAVADGHKGHQAAETALTRLIELAGPGWTGAEPLEGAAAWRDRASQTLFELNGAIREAVSRGAPEAARTTLVFALVRPRQNLLAFASMGDSHIFHVGSREVVDLAYDARRSGFYLGFPAETQPSLRERCVAGSEELAGTRALVLASDGLSERGIGVELPEATVSECVDRSAHADSPVRALELARSVCEQALESQQRQRSGDNVAAAVIWLDD